MIRSLLFLAAISLLAPAVAQPTGRPVPVAEGETSARQIDATVRAFVENLNGSNVYFGAVDKVFGVTNYGYFGGPAWGAEWGKKRGALRLEIEKIEVSEVKATGAKARVSYFWRSDAPRFRSQTIEENLGLIIGTPPSLGEKARWQIVAQHTPKTRDEATMTYHQPPPENAKGAAILPDNEPVLAEAAFEIAFPGQAKSQAAQWSSLESGEKSLANLQKLGLAALQFTQDYDQKFALAPEYFQEALLPYSHQPEIALIPASGQPYTFNRNLSGQSSAPAQLPNASRTVMFYEGENEKPVFRYATRAAILFADGHAALVSYQESQSLKWKP
ncbi:prepilin-type processing-associated H-X9-DG domain-containing protein [Abditibacterium utsteinense]|uniref:Prepilin-type processing-associated H-X9-DG domain-containing protein n=1 Tax=Abditibacterium utsteinense TaxID=1960156 RepID=A0A2S8STQ5_9BACT|nr:hypothetical protein [Abditibacterium utsteinense]PQV64185.1 prepilin-type processing-associated H-X9-DG domain-containing protein [Abditibacterium utsteinense]